MLVSLYVSFQLIGKLTARTDLTLKLDELRRSDGDPLSRAPDVGFYRLELYRDEAAALLDRLVGDLLVEA